MGYEKILFKSEEKKNRVEIAGILRQVADRIESGSMTLWQGEDKLELNFPENMEVEIKVEEEEKAAKKRSLEIEIEWLVGRQQAGMRIS